MRTEYEITVTKDDPEYEAIAKPRLASHPEEFRAEMRTLRPQGIGIMGEPPEVEQVRVVRLTASQARRARERFMALPREDRYWAAGRYDAPWNFARREDIEAVLAEDAKMA